MSDKPSAAAMEAVQKYRGACPGGPACRECIMLAEWLDAFAAEQVRGLREADVRDIVNSSRAPGWHQTEEGTRWQAFDWKLMTERFNAALAQLEREQEKP